MLVYNRNINVQGHQPYQHPSSLRCGTGRGGAGNSLEAPPPFRSVIKPQDFGVRTSYFDLYLLRI